MRLSSSLWNWAALAPHEVRPPSPSIWYVNKGTSQCWLFNFDSYESTILETKAMTTKFQHFQNITGRGEGFQTAVQGKFEDSSNRGHEYHDKNVSRQHFNNLLLTTFRMTREDLTRSPTWSMLGYPFPLIRQNSSRPSKHIPHNEQREQRIQITSLEFLHVNLLKNFL